MGIMTTATLGGLKKTVPSCDRCGAASAILAGTSGRMLCNECEAKSDPVNEAVLARVAEAKAAQGKARQAARSV